MNEKVDTHMKPMSARVCLFMPALLAAALMGFCARGHAQAAVQAAPSRAVSTSACQLVASATLPLRVYRGHFLSELSIENRSIGMIVDSGAAHSVITPALAQALGLKANERNRVRVNGIGGASRITTRVTAHRIKFGGLEKLSYDLTVADVGRPDEDSDPQAPGGVLGADLLSSYDIEFDFPKQQMTLYTASGCTGDFVPWPEPHQHFDAIRSASNALLIPLALDRHPLLALIDTGAQASVLSRDGALAAGVDPAVLERDPLGGISGMNGLSVTTHRHRFSTMEVGNSTFKDVALLVQEGRFKEAEMLLGLDFLRWRKVWLSYGTKQVFMQFAPRARTDAAANPASSVGTPGQ
jgi:predicted aspartyl protease